MSKQPAAVRYLCAVAFVLAAWLLRRAADPLIGNEAPYLLFGPAAIAGAWYGGFGPGVLATILAAVGAIQLHVPELTSDVLTRPEVTMPASALIVLGLTASLVSERSHRSRVRLSAERWSGGLPEIGEPRPMPAPEPRPRGP